MRRAVVASLSLVLVLGLTGPAFAKDKGAKDKSIASGEIVSMDGRTLVLKQKKEEDDATFTLNSETEYRRANDEVTAGHFKIGDRVRVKYRMDDEVKIAVRVEMWIAPDQVRRGHV